MTDLLPPVAVVNAYANGDLEASVTCEGSTSFVNVDENNAVLTPWRAKQAMINGGELSPYSNLEHVDVWTDFPAAKLFVSNWQCSWDHRPEEPPVIEPVFECSGALSVERGIPGEVLCVGDDPISGFADCTYGSGSLYTEFEEHVEVDLPEGEGDWIHVRGWACSEDCWSLQTREVQLADEQTVMVQNSLGESVLPPPTFDPGGLYEGSQEFVLHDLVPGARVFVEMRISGLWQEVASFVAPQASWGVDLTLFSGSQVLSTFAPIRARQELCPHPDRQPIWQEATVRNCSEMPIDFPVQPARHDTNIAVEDDLFRSKWIVFAVGYDGAEEKIGERPGGGPGQVDLSRQVGADDLAIKVVVKLGLICKRYHLWPVIH